MLFGLVLYSLPSMQRDRIQQNGPKNVFKKLILILSPDDKKSLQITQHALS